MSPAAPSEDNTLDSSSVSSSPAHAIRNNENRRFADLRGVRWRIDLGVLPSSSSSSSSYIDDLRRVMADSRRRYAGLRRRLLVDPNISKDGSTSPDLHIDNPLSQNPDSMWGRFFRNAELERMVDQDLSRLYPEHGIYFQTTECQSMLRRILLIWCLKHPEYGYRQGMHELMAPLLYVLHADVEQLSQMRNLHEDHFIDKFDDFSFYENDVTYSFDFKKLSESPKTTNTGLQNSRNISSLDDIDPKLQDIILLSDAYGAEGELGVVLSEKFMEHDAYCMFDALMSGAGGEVAMADFFFSPAPLGGSHTGLPPVIEASFALYHLLSVVDASLHSHLVELGVEPQYFALRWLRVLFGREFSLDNLLLLWDEIFACDNSKSDTREDDHVLSFRVLNSPRGAYISAIAVSMMLHMRSSLLATENATSCLQRLLNFPANISLKKLISKAKSLQALSLDSNNSIPLSMLAGSYDRNKPVVMRGHSLSMDSISPRTGLNFVPESYWEEKWRNLHKEEEQRSIGAELPRRKKGWSEKVRQTLSRKGSAPTPSRFDSSKEEPKLSVRRSLLEDLSRQLGLEEDLEESRRNDESGQIGPSEEDRGHCVHGTNKNNSCTAEERKTLDSPSPDYGSDSEGSRSHRSGPDQSFDFSVSHQALAEPDYHTPNHQVNRSEGSSVASNSSVDENDDEGNHTESFNTLVEDLPLPVSDSPENGSFRSVLNEDPAQGKTDRQEYPDDVSSESGHISSKSGKEHLDEVSESGKHIETMPKPAAASKDRKPLSGKLQWLWKLGRNNNGEGISERSVAEVTGTSSHQTYQNAAASPAISGSNNSYVSSNGDAMDQSLAITLKDLGKSMIEKIQVIESVIQTEASVVEKEGRVTAMEALEELRKISNHLCGIGG